MKTDDQIAKLISEYEEQIKVNWSFHQSEIDDLTFVSELRQDIHDLGSQIKLTDSDISLIQVLDRKWQGQLIENLKTQKAKKSELMYQSKNEKNWWYRLSEIENISTKELRKI